MNTRHLWTSAAVDQFDRFKNWYKLHGIKIACEVSSANEGAAYYEYLKKKKTIQSVVLKYFERLKKFFGVRLPLVMILEFICFYFALYISVTTL
jgi:hypothetical protein